jgi:hypothetical protein
MQSQHLPGGLCRAGLEKSAGSLSHEKIDLIGTAIAALVVTPIFAASIGNAQNRKNVGTNSGYCKSGAEVSDMKQCKENGGNE